MQKRVSVHLHVGSASAERVVQGSGRGGGGWGHLQNTVHMAAAWLGCKMAMISIGWTNSRPGCMNGLRKGYSVGFHL